MTRHFYSVGYGLVVKPSAYSEFDKEQPSAIFFRQHHTDFSASISLSFLPQREGEKAGIMLFQNEKFCVSFSVAMLDDKPSVIVECTENSRVIVASMPLPPALYSSQLSLRIDGRGGYADFYWSPDGKEWQALAVGVDVTNLSTQKAGGFVGTMISLFACN